MIGNMHRTKDIYYNCFNGHLERNPRRGYVYFLGALVIFAILESNEASQDRG